jgi:DNA polymerase-3 subunit delta'
MRSGALTHAFIVTGGTGARRAAFALDAAALLLGGAEGRVSERIAEGNCPDLIVLAPDGDSIKTEQVTELSASLRSKPFSADRMVAIIENADVMTPQSQNKLLKTLEEPAPGTVLLLQSDNPERLLQTIRSRCIILRLDAAGADHGGSGESLSDAKTALSAALQHVKPLADMFAICDKYAGSRRDAAGFLHNMETFLRDMVVGVRDSGLIADAGNREIAAQLTMQTDKTFRAAIGLIEETRRDIERGMNIKYCLRDMGVRIRQEGLYGKSS